MANKSLIVGSLSRNEIFELAHIFEGVFRYFCTLSNSPVVFSPLEQCYYRALRTAVGLGFTQSWVDNDNRLPYFSWLNRFISQGEFKENPTVIPSLSLCLAKMVHEGSVLFRASGYPELYPYFSDAVKAMLDNHLVHALGKEEDACDVLLKLFYE